MSFSGEGMKFKHRNKHKGHQTVEKVQFCFLGMRDYTYGAILFCHDCQQRFAYEVWVNPEQRKVRA